MSFAPISRSGECLGSSLATNNRMNGRQVNAKKMGFFCVEPEN